MIKYIVILSLLLNSGCKFHLKSFCIHNYSDNKLNHSCPQVGHGECPFCSERDKYRLD